MTNAQVGIIAGAIVIAGAIIGFSVSGSKKEPAPKDRAKQATDFVEAIAENFHTVSETVKVEMVRSTIASLEKDIELYAQNHGGHFPDALDVFLVPKNSIVTTSDIESDAWGRAYRYSVSAGTSSSKSFDLHSLGPDGRDGTPDDIYAKKL